MVGFILSTFLWLVNLGNFESYSHGVRKVYLHDGLHALKTLRVSNLSYSILNNVIEFSYQFNEIVISQANATYLRGFIFYGGMLRISAT